MTKIKKALALMMVLVMAMTTLALPASAVASEKELEPCAAVMECTTCGNSMTLTKTVTNAAEYRSVVAYECGYYAPAHNHVRTVSYKLYSCATCGTSTKVYTSVSAYNCPYLSSAISELWTIGK